MGQQKGNPIPSPQNQAYEALRPNLGARANRDMGTKPVMIDDMTTLSEVVDLTFETDAVAAMVSASIETTLATKATTTNVNSISASIATRLNNTAFNYVTGSFANDGAAATAGVPIGGLYHTTGTVKVRLT